MNEVRTGEKCTSWPRVNGVVTYERDVVVIMG